MGKLAKEKCKCGSNVFEKVDVTPPGNKKKRYFMRCKKCGLVVFAHRCKSGNNMLDLGLLFWKKICKVSKGA